MPIEAKILGPDDVSVLATVAPGVFDRPVNPRFAAEFLSDPRHHLAVVVDGGAVIGFASAVHYIHPDKPAFGCPMCPRTESRALQFGRRAPR